jgi:hypothetical protein
MKDGLFWIGLIFGVLIPSYIILTDIYCPIKKDSRYLKKYLEENKG